MIVRALFHDRETCEAFVFENDQKRGVYPRDKPLPRCMNVASYEVDGKLYCKRHAMMVVFDKVMEG